MRLIIASLADRRVGFDDSAWRFSGFSRGGAGDPDGEAGPMRAGAAGAEAVLTFTGSAVAIVGEMTPAGGRADVFLDGKRVQPVDAFAGDRTHDNDLWHAYGLPLRQHTLRIVARADADPRSAGTDLAIREAVVYRQR